MQNPERFLISRIDSETRADKIARTAERILSTFPRAEKRMQKAAIDPYTFTDLYGPENITRDAQEVTRLKSLFAKESGKRVGELTVGDIHEMAQILEYYVYTGINQGNWVPNCTAIKTSEYDDYKNGVDLVLEHTHQHNHTHLGLAVDVTFSQDITKKMVRIKQSIDADALSKVKYFSSEKSHMRGELSSIPRVVSAIDLPMLEDLFSFERRGAIAEHQVRAALVQDMETQLAQFTAYAERTGKQCATRLAQVYHLVQTINAPIQQRSDPEYLKKHRKTREQLDAALEIFT